MMTQCTTPDAPFYGFDLAAISMLESFGIDMACGAMLATGTTVLGLLVGLPVLGLALALQGRM